jgi:hypothetical protein
MYITVLVVNVMMFCLDMVLGNLFYVICRLYSEIVLELVTDIKYHSSAKNKCTCIMKFVCFQKFCEMFPVFFTKLVGCCTYCMCEKGIFAPYEGKS